MKEANGRNLKWVDRPAAAPVALRNNDAVQRNSSYPREFLHNRFVYVVVSPRARGLSVGINMNPDKKCQFNCVYCEVDRVVSPGGPNLDVGLMAAELKSMLELVRDGRLRELHAYRKLPDELLQLRHVALSGDGEPTLAPEFCEALQA